MVPVPDLIGKTEAEAQELCASVNIGMTYKGEEASTQEKGKISSQDPVQGTKVAKNSTVNYYLSKGSESVTLTDIVRSEWRFGAGNSGKPGLNGSDQ